MFLGLDRADTPDPRKRKKERELYTVCFAGLPNDLQDLRAIVMKARRQAGMPVDREFRGHDCSEEEQLILLSSLKGLELRIGVALYEKPPEARFVQNLLSPQDFQERAALSLFRKFVRRYQCTKIWCDEDTVGPSQKEFETALRKVHREIYPGIRLGVRHRPSHTSDLIQIADVVAYSLSRLERGLLQNGDLRNILARLRKDAGNIIEGPLEWGL